MKPTVPVVAIVAASVLFAGCATALSARNQEAQLLKTQVASLETQVAGLTEQLSDLSKRNAQLEAQLAKPAGQAQAAKTRAAQPLSVRQIQLALKAAGFYEGSVDGKMGPRTQEALKSFQRAQGLKADGIAGSKTSAQLAKFLSASEQ